MYSPAPFSLHRFRRMLYAEKHAPGGGSEELRRSKAHHIKPWMPAARWAVWVLIWVFLAPGVVYAGDETDLNVAGMNLKLLI